MKLFSPSAAIGIDISDDTLEIVMLEQQQSQATIRTKKQWAVPAGSVVHGAVQDKEAVVSFLQKALDTIAEKTNRDIKKVHFILPDAALFTHVFRFDHEYIEKEKLADSIAASVEKIIPLQAGDIRYSYSVKEKTDQYTEVIIVALDHAVLAEWQAVFAAMDVEVESYDTAAFAQARAIAPDIKKYIVALIDCGAHTTTISIVDATGVLYSQQIHIAGYSITSNIAKALDIAKEKAEEKKIQNGLVEGDETYTQAAQKSIDSLIVEIKKNISYVEQTYNKKITHIFLMGGTAKLKGLAAYIQEAVAIDTGKAQGQIHESDVLFMPAIGAALRGFDSSYAMDFSFTALPEKVKKQKKVKKSAQQKSTPSAEAKKIKIQIIILICIVVIGALVVAGAWYTKQSDTTSQSDAARERSLDQIEQLPE